MPKRARGDSTVTTMVVKKGRSAPAKARAPRSVINKTLATVNLGRAFPLKARTVLRYVETQNLVPGAGTYTQAVFRANSLFDPDYAIGGHQPYGFNQYELLYNHYKVIKSTINVKFCAYDDEIGGGIVGVNITPGGTDSDAPGTRMEKQEGKKNYQFVNPGAPRHTVNMTWTAKGYFGVQKDEQDLSAAIGADPVEISYFNVWALNPGGTSTNILALVTLEYHVEFSEPKSLGQSS